MIRVFSVASGKTYGLTPFLPGRLQYMDRDYRFNYIPSELQGVTHVQTCGDDKMLGENEPCFALETDRPAEIYILYPDKQPVIPGWLADYERVRMNVTRQDSQADTLKGYFSLSTERYFPPAASTFSETPPPPCWPGTGMSTPARPTTACTPSP